MSKQLTLFGKPIRVNRYFKNPSSSYEHFISKQWKERGHSFATKQKFIDEARRNWKEMAPKEREDYIGVAPKKIEPKVKNERYESIVLFLVYFLFLYCLLFLIFFTKRRCGFFVSLFFY